MKIFAQSILSLKRVPAFFAAPAILSSVLALSLALSFAQPSGALGPKSDIKRYMSRGDQLFESGAYHGCLSFYKQAITSEPANWEAHMKYGRVLARLGQNDEAVKELFQSILLNERSPETNLIARAEIAAVFMKQGNYDEAGGQLKQIIDLSPDDMVVRGNYAICLEHLGFVDASIEQFKTLVKTNPYDTVALYNLGTAYLRKGDSSTASLFFKRVVAINANHVLSYLGLAKAMMMKGDNQMALTYCKNAIRVAPENHYAYLTLGDVYERAGDKTMATAAYRRAIQLNPTDSASKAALSKILESSRQLAGSSEMK